MILPQTDALLNPPPFHFSGDELRSHDLGRMEPEGTCVKSGPELANVDGARDITSELPTRKSLASRSDVYVPDGIVVICVIRLIILRSRCLRLYSTPAANRRARQCTSIHTSL